MDNNEFSILEANVYLKEGSTVKTISDNVMIYFRLVKDKVRVSSVNFKSFLSLKEFNELYSKSSFMLHESKVDGEIDLKKDEEYYSWNHK